jgi:phosphatidylglycerophosphatase A
LFAYGLLAVRASELVEKEVGSKDPGFIVADEWIGLGLALWPVRDSLAHWPTPVISAPAWVMVVGNALPLVVPFALFRLFDIWKPWPCKRLQNLGGGPGIVLDDVAAGIWAAAVTALLLPWYR